MQTTILPLTRCMRLGGWGLITACSTLVLATGAAWPWRLGGAGLVLILGGLLWRRYLRRRPTALHADARGRLHCTLADGGDIEVRRLMIGAMNPWLASARLYVADGRCLDLFVPGRSLSAVEHWRLRRALLGFRPEAATDAAPGAG